MKSRRRCRCLYTSLPPSLSLFIFLSPFLFRSVSLPEKLTEKYGTYTSRRYLNSRRHSFSAEKTRRKRAVLSPASSRTHHRYGFHFSFYAILLWAERNLPSPPKREWSTHTSRIFSYLIEQITYLKLALFLAQLLFSLCITDPSDRLGLLTESWVFPNFQRLNVITATQVLNFPVFRFHISRIETMNSMPRRGQRMECILLLAIAAKI